MTGLWNPEFWSNLGASGLALLVAVLFVVALMREWIVIGKTYRAEVLRLESRALKDAESIATLSRAVTEKNAAEDATTRILSALRQSLITTTAGDG